MCAARPILILLSSALSDSRRGRLAARYAALVQGFRAGRRTAIGAGGIAAAAVFAVALVLAGTPARSERGGGRRRDRRRRRQRDGLGPSRRRCDRPADGQAASRATPSRISARRRTPSGTATRAGPPPARAAAGSPSCNGEIRAAAGGSIVVPAYRVERAHVSLEPGVGQGPPTVVSVLEGTVERSTYSGGSLANVSAARFKQAYELMLEGNRFVIVGTRGDGTAAPAQPAVMAGPSVTSKGTAAFAGVKLTNVAAQVGLHFRQGAFRFGVIR